MITPRRWRPRVPALAADDIICGRTEPFTLNPGSPLRGATCVVCGFAAGRMPVFIFTVFQFCVPAERCGAFPAGSWLVHQCHPALSDDAMAYTAIMRHQTCLEETT